MSKIFVAFYEADQFNDFNHRAVSLLSGDKYTHVGLIAKDAKRSMEFFACVGREAGKKEWRIEEALRKKIKPSAVIYLGEKNISLSQLYFSLADTYRLEAKAVWFWFLLGRFLFPYMLPPTCSTITCLLLRMCGEDVQIHVRPQELYKELTNENHNHCRTSWSWEDYSSQDHC